MKLLAITAYIFTLGVAYSHACANPEKVVKDKEKKEWLEGHNKARAEVGVKPLAWDEGLARTSENYAKKLAKKCGKLIHSKSGYGENLAAKWGGKPLESWKVVVGWWVNEKQWYKYKTNTCQDGKVCGHYTQVVWSNSKRLGCGTASCTEKGSDAKKTYMVCSYDPPGNWNGSRPY